LQIENLCLIILLEWELLTNKNVELQLLHAINCLRNQMSVTIYDIAKKLKTSPSTVSRVLNNSSLISNSTTTKIHEMARELGYEPRIIKRQQNRAIITIKLIVGPKNDHLLPIFYDFTDLISGIRAGAEGLRLNLAVEMNHENFNPFDHKKGGNMDGVVFAFTKPSDSIYEDLSKRKIPNITINRNLPGQDFVTCNNYLGIKELVNQLHSKRDNLKICFLHLTPHNDISLERLNCLKKISAEKKISFQGKDVIAIESLELINKDFFANIKKKYNAIIAMNDVLAITVLARASSFGFQIPKDFSLTGFDNSPVRNLLPQKVDTISLPVSEIGFKVGQWIHHRIIQKEQTVFQQEITGVYQNGDTI